MSDTARRCTSLFISFAFVLASVLPAATPTFAQAFPKAAKEHSAPAGAAAGGCQLNSARGNIKHVVTIIFDNMHFQRDPARDGSTLVPSDLEQMPHLLNFLKNNGVLLSNHHTPLISHTSDDVITILTGVYPAHHGVAFSANSYLEYKPDGTIPASANQSGFTYWTDLTVDNSYNLISGAADASHPNGVNAPAPWVPFTRAGCDVGAVAAADMEIENTGVDLSTVFGAGSPQTTDPNAFANYEGIAVHCAKNSTLCSSANGGFPDKLPWEPNADGSPATPDATGTSTAYQGYNALFGHKYVTQAFQTLGLGSKVLDANGNLKDIDGNVIVDDFRGSLTPGFPGFGIAPQYALGYVADMLEAGVPVIYSYINTPHRPVQLNPYGYGFPSDPGDYGPGEAHYVQTLQQYDDSFNKFFTRLANDGITPANTLFIITAEEGDHVVAANPTNPGCDGVTTPCTYGNTNGNEVGEVNLNFRGLLQAETGITTFAGVNSDDAPDIYLTGNPAQDDATLRAFERASGTLTVTNPISKGTDTVAQEMANQAEFKMLHMQTFDPLRNPSFTIFANPDYFITGSTACGTSTSPATDCVKQAPGFAWNHGDVQPQITTIWLGMAGPGIDQAGLDSVTFSDHTDIRATTLTLVGLQDDYQLDGRALTEKFTGWAQPSAVKKSGNFVALAQALKQINAPVGPLGLASLHASTVAMKSGDTNNDSTFTSIEGQLDSFRVQRDALVAQILPLLEAAEFDGTPIPTATAQSLIQQAQALLASVEAYAGSL
ncbi:MAG TPA: hypothetical protein VNI81_12145 [Candidatus Limnocylindrales bacterium]|nr:hypothetical protein [Candidatus Limnocylindrales bacterium]